VVAPGCWNIETPTQNAERARALLSTRFEQGLWLGASAINEPGSRSACYVMAIH